MGTTLTAVALVGGEGGRDTLALANVGDSRAYLFSEGQIVQVTADHSLAEERMRHGEMTEAEAAVHPQRHILTRALGISSEVETDMWELQLRAGDRLVLCSDGLSNELSRQELAEVLKSVPDPGEAAQKLVEIANEHGGSDNITVIVVDVLLGEDSSSRASVITPIGARAGSQLAIVPGAASPTASVADVTEPDLTVQIPFAGSENLQMREHSLDETQAVPVAHAIIRSAVAPPPIAATTPPNESRRERRRRLGIPRRLTVRVILFVLLVAAIPTAAFFAIHWYAYDNWFFSVQKNEIVIQQGHPGGVLWFDPKVVDHTHTKTSQLLSAGMTQIRAGVQEPSLRAAQSYLANLHREYARVQAAKNARSSGSTTSTTASPAVTPTTTTPSTATPAAANAATPAMTTP
jgi:protein phosphatase